MRLTAIHILFALLIVAFSLGAEPALAQSTQEMPGCGDTRSNQNPCDQEAMVCLLIQGCSGLAQKLPTPGVGLPVRNIPVLAFAMPESDRNDTLYIKPETSPPRE